MGRKPERGMTLVEVMAALLVVSLGVLGAAQLQARALLASDSALRRGQAVQVAQDLLERVRASNQLGGSELAALHRNVQSFAGKGARGDAQLLGDLLKVSLQWPDGLGSFEVSARRAP